MPILYILTAIVVIFAIVVASGFFLVNELARASRLASRIELVVEGDKPPEPKPDGTSLLRFISAFGMRIAIAACCAQDPGGK